MNGYELAIYEGRTRPPDLEQVERFVIRPEDPWFGETEQEVARRSLRGDLPGLWDCWIVMRAKGVPVSVAWLHLADDCYRTGLLGYVQTDPPHRGKGLGQAVCRKAADLADEAGCGIMILGTGNAAARRLYERVGFAVWYGAAMCRPDDAYRARPVPYGDADVIRPSRWSDLGGIVRFIIEPQKQTIVDRLEGLSRENGRLHQGRVNSTGKALLVRADRDGNPMWALVNEKNQVQGLASIIGEPAGEAGAACLQLCVHPACREGGVRLAKEATDRALGQGATRVVSFTGERDSVARDALDACGFEPTGSGPRDVSIQKWVLSKGK